MMAKTMGDLMRYLKYVNPNIEVVVLRPQDYDRLLLKAKAFDKIRNQVKNIHSEIIKVKD